MKTKKFLSMAALALVGAMMTGCSNDDNYQQPENKNNVVTLTTTVSLDGGATTRALTIDGNIGVKTFAAGETMAIYYWKNKGKDHVKAVSAPLTAGDITNGGKSATFTFTLDNPYKDMSVVYTYPAAMANADFLPNYDALYNTQDGTLATLASDFDFCTRLGSWVGENLPSLTLENQLAILAITLKNADGSSDITSSITGMTISDGTNTYTVSRSAAAGPIYVAIRPTTSATIDITATDGSKNYAKTLATTKTYEAGNGYSVSWRMAEAGPTAYTLAESTVGMIVGTDGKAYAVEDKDNLPTGVTAVAMVAYKSGSNGLAIQLNEFPEEGEWNEAKTYAAGLDEVPGGTWRLPSKDDWQNMFVGCAVSGDATVPDGNNDMNPIAGFKAKIAATGIEWWSGTYWSSTETDSDSEAWDVNVYLDYDDAYADFNESDTSNSVCVLGCLAF